MYKNASIQISVTTYCHLNTKNKAKLSIYVNHEIIQKNK